MVDVARDSSAPSSPATGPGPGQPAGSSSVSGAGNVMRLIAAIGSPIAIATGLLFYFGWVRASVQAKQLGYDTAILDWSVQDYILRSILVLFIPLMVLIGLMLLLTWLHQRLVLPMAEAGKLATWIPRALRGGWLLWIPAAIALSVVAAPLSGITVAMAVTVSLLCALYGDLLERRLTGSSRTSSAAKALVLVLLAFAAFWTVERLANLVGRAYATQITANPRQLLAVTVYSPKSLEIHVPGIVETKLRNPESAYQYRYDGLRLVQRSGDRYLLMSEHWDPRTSSNTQLNQQQDRAPHCLLMSDAYPEELRERVEEPARSALRRAEAGDGGFDEAMRYSLLAGGKRIRPVLALATARAIGATRRRSAAAGRGDRADPHLFADPRRPAGDGRRRPAPRAPDVPQGVRRGRGDPRRRRPLRRGLPPRARAPEGDPRGLLAAVTELAAATGVSGMVGGQYVDVRARGRRTAGLRRAARS